MIHAFMVMCIFNALPNVFTDDFRTSTSVSVLNACRLKTPDGQLNTIKGYATRPNDKEQGKLEVVFDRADASALGKTNCE